MKIKCSLLSFLLLIISQSVYSQNISTPDYSSAPFFDGGSLSNMRNLGCAPCSAPFGVKYDSAENAIIWKWQNKAKCWCGWMLEGLPVRNFHASLIENFGLEIRYQGTYNGSPSPQIKFLDSQNQETQLINFSNYELKNNKGEFTVLIPLRSFAIPFNIDGANVNKLQFDAGWNSYEGDIKIYSIRLKSPGNVNSIVYQKFDKFFDFMFSWDFSHLGQMKTYLVTYGSDRNYYPMHDFSDPFSEKEQSVKFSLKRSEAEFSDVEFVLVAAPKKYAELLKPNRKLFKKTDFERTLDNHKEIKVVRIKPSDLITNP